MLKNPVGRPPHVPDEQTRKYVEKMFAVGIPQEEIARVIGISVDTLARCYRYELDCAATKANAAVGNSIWLQAVGGPKQDWRKAVPTSAIFWAKTRMRWRDRESNNAIIEGEALPDDNLGVIRVEIIGNPEHTRQIAKEAEDAALRRRADDHE